MVAFSEPQKSEEAWAISGWSKHFESADTRKRARPLDFVKVPTDMFSDGMLALRAEPETLSETLGLWLSLIELGARCPMRGLLVRAGRPMDPSKIALATGIPKRQVVAGLGRLRNVGWISCLAWPQELIGYAYNDNGQTANNGVSSRLRQVPADCGIDWHKTETETETETSPIRPPRGPLVSTPFQMIVAEWNLRTGGRLPTIRKAPSDARRRLLKRMWKACLEAAGGDREDAALVMGEAMAAASRDSGYQDDQRGIDTFCRRLDRWLDGPPGAEIRGDTDERRQRAAEQLCADPSEITYDPASGEYELVR